jgi:hypothetical protein
MKVDPSVEGKGFPVPAIGYGMLPDILEGLGQEVF